MLKKNLRILSLALAILLMATAVTLPPVDAAALDSAQIKTQIKNTYKKVARFFGRNSMDGYCGAYVSGQLYMMGINKDLIGGDGKDQYDTFKNLTFTSGGYRVKAYPASAYDLKTALNTITKNGTQNAYNILVGFQKTRSSAGQRYGHATVIHAILDGKVYFSESYDMGYKGKSYREGTPVVLSINDFAAYYAATTTQLDGVIHFGLKTYAESCTFYSASFYAQADEYAEIWNQPCDESVEETSRMSRLTVGGEILEITGLYKNTVGEYWYQVEGGIGHIRAEQVKMTQLITEDVFLKDMKTPSILRQSRSYNIQGVAVSQHSQISTLRAQIYQITEDGVESVLSVTDTVNTKSYNFKNSKIAKNLTFRKLAVGQYRLEIAAILCNNYVEDGQLQTRWDTVTLWQSDFLVNKSTTSSDTVVFDACGGTASLNQTSVAVGQSIGALPLAQRLDYVFLGWYTEMEGGDRVRDDYVPADSMTLYAHWVSIEQMDVQWQENGQCWYLYSDGLTTIGCIELDGILYYFSSVDPANQGEKLWTAMDAA